MRTAIKTVLVTAALALAVSGCGSDKSAAPATTTTSAAPLTTTTVVPVTAVKKAVATPTPMAASLTTYCANVIAALAAKPPDGQADKAAYAKYAAVLTKVVNTSPASQKAYWSAAQRLSQAIAAGGTGTDADGQYGLAHVMDNFTELHTDCGINEE